MAQSVVGMRARLAVTALLSGAIALGGTMPVALAGEEDIAISEAELDEQSVLETQSGPVATTFGDEDEDEITRGWTRLAGIEDSKNNRHADRYGTMEKIVEEAYNTRADTIDPINYVVIASGADFPDALTASSLAGLRGWCPVLLTKPNKLSDETKTQLEKLKPKRQDKKMTAYIMGGTKSVSDAVVKEIEDLDINTVRIAGTDRIGTSVEVFKHVKMIKPTLDRIILATESTFADSLSIGPLAYDYNYPIPIILVKKDGMLSPEALAAIKDDHAIKDILIIGGTNSVSDKVISEQLGSTDYHFKRLAGADRYETSKSVAEYLNEECGYSWSNVCVATGKNYPDALVGAAFAGKNNSPLLLADKETDVTIELAVKKKKDIEIGNPYVLGGEKSVSKALKDYLDEKIPVHVDKNQSSDSYDPAE